MNAELKKQFEEAREYYKELLGNAKPLPEGTLTVDRINNLHINNKKYIKLIQELEEFVLNSKVPNEFKKDFQGLILKRI